MSLLGVVSSSFWSTPTAVSAVVATVVGALTSSIITVVYHSVAARRSTMREIIDEFLEPDFLVHRAVVSSLRRKVEGGEIQIDAVARGYWYPGPTDKRQYYKGEKIGDLNEHQHLEVFIGYMSRLAYRVRSGRVDRRELRRRLRSAYRYHGPFMNSMASAVRLQIESNCPGEEVPSWVGDVTEIAALLNVTERLKIDA